MNEYPPFVTSNNTEFCVAPGCQQPLTSTQLLELRTTGRAHELPTARPAVPDTDLCPQHHLEFKEHLRALASLYPAVDAAILRTPSKEITEKVQTSGVSDTSALWNPAATVAVRELATWAGYLTEAVITQRVLPERSHTLVYPEPRAGLPVEGPPQRLVTRYSYGLTLDTHPATALAALALHHAYWLSSYPTIGPQLLVQAKQHRRAAERALNVHPSRRIRINGRCQVVVEETDFGPILCEGQLYALLRTDGQNIPSQIVCGTDPRHLTPKPAAGWPEHTGWAADIGG